MPVPSARTCRIRVAALSGDSCGAGRQRLEIGQRQTEGECRLVGPEPTIAAPQWKASQSRAGAAAGVEPDRRLVIDQRQQHRGGGAIEWRGCRRGSVPRGAVVPAVPSHRARRGRCTARPARDRRSPQGDAGAHVRMFRMAKNWTRVAAAFAAVASRPACCAVSERFDQGGEQTRLARGILQQGIGQCRELRLSFVAAGDIGMADETIIGAHRAAGHRHLAQVERAHRLRPPGRAPSPARTPARAVSGIPAAPDVPSRPAIAAGSARASTAIQSRRALCGSVRRHGIGHCGRLHLCGCLDS